MTVCIDDLKLLAKGLVMGGVDEGELKQINAKQIIHF